MFPYNTDNTNDNQNKKKVNISELAQEGKEFLEVLGITPRFMLYWNMESIKSVLQIANTMDNLGYSKEKIEYMSKAIFCFVNW